MKQFLLLFGVLCVFATQTFAAQPNIIFILTDDQGYGDLERHGHPLIRTPHTNRLHDESVRFDNFYVSPSCSPTRAALLTGMHEFRHGVTHTQQPREHLHRDAVILPQLLQKAGYHTGFIGKWHLGGGKGFVPKDRGFEWTATNGGGPRVHFDPVMIRNGKREKRKGFREDLFFDEAMTFIDASKGKPFFCYLATYSPHTPLAAPEEFIAPFRGRGKVTDEQATYLAMVANIDANVGRLLKFLKDRDLEKKTIIVFMNDNGQTKGLDVYNAGMRGCKCTIWEGGSRAMSFWRWPGRWKPHKVENLTAHLDVVPTLCELAGVKIPAELLKRIEGFSLVPLLEANGPMKWHDDRMLFHHVARWPGGLAAAHKYAMCAVRQGNHLLLRSTACNEPKCERYVSQCTTLRLVRRGAKSHTYTNGNAQFHWGASPPGRWVLFNSKTDPACRNDLSAKHPQLVKKLANAYDKWWDEVFPQMIAAGGDKGEFPLRPTNPARP
jgi:arylsulfatase A-like enzyme